MKAATGPEETKNRKKSPKIRNPGRPSAGICAYFCTPGYATGSRPDRTAQTMKENILDIKTVCECNRCLGCKTQHPQAAIINLERPGVGQEAVKFEFYTILLIEDCEDNCNCCGRRYYDFSYATMVFLTPGEIFRMSKTNTLPSKGLLLAFHPDLLFRTALKRHIDDYTFFHYRKEEALHLSLREKATVTKYMNDIAEELSHAIDSHTSTLVSRLIELLLDYCTRFYERQFITREDKNKHLLDRLERLLDDSIATGQLAQERFPTAASCAESLGLSEAYFHDLLKFETGKTLDEYLQLKRIAAAKHLLLSMPGSVSDVARLLGYPNVYRFGVIFKRLTGMSPREFKVAQN